MTADIIQFAPLPLAVRLRDEEGPPLPQMTAQRRAQLEAERAATPFTAPDTDPA